MLNQYREEILFGFHFGPLFYGPIGNILWTISAAFIRWKVYVWRNWYYFLRMRYKCDIWTHSYFLLSNIKQNLCIRDIITLLFFYILEFNSKCDKIWGFIRKRINLSSHLRNCYPHLLHYFNFLSIKRSQICGLR